MLDRLKFCKLNRYILLIGRETHFLHQFNKNKENQIKKKTELMMSNHQSMSHDTEVWTLMELGHFVKWPVFLFILFLLKSSHPFFLSIVYSPSGLSFPLLIFFTLWQVQLQCRHTCAGLDCTVWVSSGSPALMGGRSVFLLRGNSGEVRRSLAVGLWKKTNTSAKT